MAIQNVNSSPLIPEVPKVLAKEQLFVYTPIATFNSVGMAKYQETQFTISADGLVAIKDSYVTGLIDVAFEKKLDKVETTSSYTQLYAKETDGTQKMLNVAVNPIVDTVVKRTGYGRVKTVEGAENDDAVNVGQAVKVLSGTTQTPMKIGIENESYSFAQRDDKGHIKASDATADDEVTTLKQVTDGFVTKITNTGKYGLVYIADENGVQTTFPITSETTEPYTVVRRNDSGQVVTADATANNRAVPLGQLVSKLANYLLKTGGVISGDLTIQGDLNVTGTTVTEDTETLNVKDAIVVTNSEGADISSTLAGFVIRLNATDCYGIVYDKSSDSVKLGLGVLTDGKFTFNEGEGEAVATRADSSALTDTHLIQWDGENNKLVDSGKTTSDFVEKIGAWASFFNVYAQTIEGRTILLPVFDETDENTDSIPYRNKNGTIKTAAPITDLDCVNLKYITDNFLRCTKLTVTQTITPSYIKTLKPGVYYKSIEYKFSDFGYNPTENYGEIIWFGDNNALFIPAFSDGFYTLKQNTASADDSGWTWNRLVVSIELDKCVKKLNAPLRMYCTNSFGGDASIQYTTTATAWLIPQRDSNGNLKTNTPANDSDSTNKKYVDDADAKKLSKPTGNPSEASVVQVAKDGTTSYKPLSEIGGGSEITVDQTYSATSENAQSGKAVAEAVSTINATQASTTSFTTLEAIATAAIEASPKVLRVPYANIPTSLITPPSGLSYGTCYFLFRVLAKPDSSGVGVIEVSFENISTSTKNIRPFGYLRQGISGTTTEWWWSDWINIPTGDTSIYTHSVVFRQERGSDNVMLLLTINNRDSSEYSVSDLSELCNSVDLSTYSALIAVSSSDTWTAATFTSLNAATISGNMVCGTVDTGYATIDTSNFTFVYDEVKSF